MIVCPWRKKYETDIAREERLAAKFKPMFGPSGPTPNFHAEAVQRARDNLHKLSIDHRMGGCICQAAPAKLAWNNEPDGIISNMILALKK